jgi:hypothetical protein
VLLVDDHEAEALRLDLLPEQLVRADDDIELAIGELLQHRRRLLRALEPRKLRDAHRPVGEAVGEGLEVLLGEQRGRAEHEHLLAIGHRNEGGAQRDLGLAEADVAADQAVHRLSSRHVGGHGLDRCRLVGRLLEAEAGGERFHVMGSDGKGMTQAGCALRVEREQLSRGVAHLLRCARLRLVPLPAAELVQRRFLGLRAAVTADHAELRDGHVELVAALVLEQQELALAVLQAERLQPQVAADSVLLVHHRVADLELGEVAQHPLDGGALLRAARAPSHHARVELCLGDDRPAFASQREAVRDRRDGELQGSGALLELFEAGGRRGLQPVFGEVARHRLAASGRFRGEQHLQLRAREEGLQGGERVLGAPVDGEPGQRLGAEAFPLCVAWLQVDPRMLAQPQIELFRRKEKLRRGEQRPVRIAARHLVAGRRVAPEIADGGGDVAVQRNRAAFRQVVEERRHGVEEERQVVLDARGGDAGRDVAVERLLGRIALEELAPAAAESRAPFVVERKLARRQEPDLLHRVNRALGIDVEGLDGIDQIVVEVEAVGKRSAHREEVDQPAAHADFARRYHLRHVLVAGGRELGTERVHGKPLAGLEKEGPSGYVRGRAEPHQRCRRRHDGDVEVAALNAIERGEPLGDEVLVRRELVVGQRLPVGQQAHAQRRREPADLLDEALRILRVRADDRERLLQVGETRERERIGGARELRDAPSRGN